MTIARSNEGRQTGKPSPSSTRPSSDHALVELIDRILDKGLVIDAWARISLLGIELITIEARIIVASLETYLRYAEAITAVPLLAAPPPTPLAAAPSIPARPTPAPAPPSRAPAPPAPVAAAPPHAPPVAAAPPHAPQVAQAPQHTAPVAPPARSEVEGLPLMAPALQAIVATLQQQLLQATEAQLSAALSPLRQHLQHEMTSALEPVHASLPQQIQQSVEPVRTTVRQEVGRALEPIHGSLVLSSDRSSHGP